MSASEKDGGRRRRKTATSASASAGPASGAGEAACGEKWGWAFAAAISGRWLWGFRRGESEAWGRAERSGGGEAGGVLPFRCGFSGAVWGFRGASFCAFCLLVDAVGHRELETGGPDGRTLLRSRPLGSKGPARTAAFVPNEHELLPP